MEVEGSYFELWQTPTSQAAGSREGCLPAEGDDVFEFVAVVSIFVQGAAQLKKAAGPE